jgi:hypothetical protein
MTGTFDLAPEVGAQVSEQARAEGLPLEAYLPALIAQAAQTHQSASRSGDAKRQAMGFYEDHLCPILEPRQNGKYVAIHAETQEYAVERGPGKAFRAICALHQSLGRLLPAAWSHPAVFYLPQGMVRTSGLAL